MAGSSGTGSFPHSFHHGRRNGGGGGWKSGCLGPQNQMLLELALICPSLSGRVVIKLCHHEQPKEEGLTTLATFGRFVCSIMRGRTVLEELLERDAVAELDNYRD